MNRGLKTAVAALAALAITAPAAAMPAGPDSRWGFVSSAALAPGDQQLVNFAHVYNFKPGVDFPNSTIDANSRGTDIEFFTNAVPKRDYATGTLLDAAGAPLPEGEPAVMETRDFAIMGSYGGGAWVFDITDPEAPQFVVNIPCNQTQNDVQIKQFGSRWVLALTKDNSGNPCITPRKGETGQGGLALFDVTDPYAWTKMYSFGVASGAHNFTFHPTQPVGWVSPGDINGLSATGYRAVIPIIDFTDVNNPVLATTVDLVQGSPHDITFSDDGLRAFVANEHHYRIYDTSTLEKAKAPELISVTPNNGTYAHGYTPTPDRKVVVGTNESLALGGFFAGGTTVCPGEGLTFYSIEGDREKTPVPVGHFLASVQGHVADGRVCTGHVGEMANKALVTGWYIGGVRVVDFTNPSQPVEAGIAVMPGAEVWAAKWHKGPYIFAADQRRGFDVFRWTGTAQAPWLA